MKKTAAELLSRFDAIETRADANSEGEVDSMRTLIAAAFLRDWAEMSHEDAAFVASRLDILMAESAWNETPDRTWRLGLLASFLTEATDPQGRLD